jgi:hypothetical protein
VKTQLRGEQVTVRLTTKDVGHRVPTGFIDRHLLLVVEASTENEPISLVEGAKLPSAAGAALQNLPGEIFGRLLRDPDGNSPAPFWRAGVKFEDTRLLPGETRESVYTFAKAAQQVRVRLLYRKFWPDVAEAKGWPDDTITLHDEVIPNR